MQELLTITEPSPEWKSPSSVLFSSLEYPPSATPAPLTTPTPQSPNLSRAPPRHRPQRPPPPDAATIHLRVCRPSGHGLRVAIFCVLPGHDRWALRVTASAHRINDFLGV